MFAFSRKYHRPQSIPRFQSWPFQSRFDLFQRISELSVVALFTHPRVEVALPYIVRCGVLKPIEILQSLFNFLVESVCSLCLVGVGSLLAAASVPVAAKEFEQVFVFAGF